MKTLFKTYYGLTVGTFFTSEQKTILLNLLACVHGVELQSSEYLQIQQTIDEIDSLGLETSVDCSNWLFLNKYHEELNANFMTEAITELSEVITQNIQYSSPWEWYQAMQDDPDTHHFVLAMFEYCGGNVERAISHLKSSVKQNPNDLLTLECLAHICFDSEFYEDSYYYLCSAKSTYKKLHRQEKPWVSLCIQKMEKRLVTEKKVESIQTIIANRINTPTKHTIGFTSQL